MSESGWSILRDYRDFGLVCWNRLSSSLSNQIIQVAIMWYVYDVTNDAFALAYLGLAAFGPAVFLVLFSGYIADHFDRKVLLTWGTFVFVLASLALVILVVSGSQVVWPIYVITVVISASRSFLNTASRSIVPSLVPKEKLSNAVAFASGAEKAAIIAGPAVGGILYIFGAWLPFTFSTVILAMGTVAVFLVRYQGAAKKAKEPITMKVLMAGFEFTRSRPVVLGAISLDAMVGLLANVVILLPIFAKDILDVGPWGLGLLRSAPGVGALLMAIWLARSDYIKRHAGFRMLAAVGVFGLATLAFGLSQSFILSLLALTVLGAADMVSVVIRHTMIQADTPDELRGRVSSVNSLFTTSSSELGRFRAGLIAGLFGPVPAVVIGGVAALAITALWPVIFRDLRTRDHLVEEEAQRA